MWAPPGTIGPTPQMPGVGVIPAHSLNVVMEMPIFVIVCSSGTGFPLCTEDSLSQIYSPSQNTALVQVASASQQLSTLLPLFSSLFLHLCPHLFLFLCLLLSPYPFGSFSLASLVAQVVKNPPATRETWVQSLGWEDPPEEGMATHSSLLAWRIPMDRGALWAIAMGSQRVRHD